MYKQCTMLIHVMTNRKHDQAKTTTLTVVKERCVILQQHCCTNIDTDYLPQSHFTVKLFASTQAFFEYVPVITLYNLCPASFQLMVSQLLHSWGQEGFLQHIDGYVPSHNAAVQPHLLCMSSLTRSENNGIHC